MSLKGSLLHFSHFATEWRFKKSQRVPLLHFLTLCDFRRLQKNSKKKIIFFSFFRYCRRDYLTLRNPFAIFERQIWRRLGPFPACYFFNNYCTWQYRQYNVQLALKNVNKWIIYKQRNFGRCSGSPVGVRSLHPKIISPHIHFTPHSFHPTFISPHFHFTPYCNSTKASHVNQQLIFDAYCC